MWIWPLKPAVFPKTSWTEWCQTVPIFLEMIVKILLTMMWLLVLLIFIHLKWGRDSKIYLSTYCILIRMLSWRIRNKTYETITQYIPFHLIHKHTFSNFLRSLFFESLLCETFPSGLVFCDHFVVTTLVYSDIFFVSSVFYLLATHCFYVSSSKCFPCLQLSETSAHVMQSFLAFFISVYSCILSTLGDVRRGVVSKIHQEHHLIGFFIFSFSNLSVIMCSVYSVIQFLWRQASC